MDSVLENARAPLFLVASGGSMAIGFRSVATSRPFAGRGGRREPRKTPGPA